MALAIADEVCVADGGSRDGTGELARRLGARVVEAPRGRGAQLQAGAQGSSCDVLLFLHADTHLPQGARAAIEAALSDSGTLNGGTSSSAAVGGAFRIRYSGRSRLMHLGARFANWRAQHTRCPLGDHALFVRRDIFEELGGFRDWPLLEDLDFARRLARRGPTRLLPLEVITSARRFERLGILRTVTTNWLIVLLYLLGVAPQRLARLYYRTP